MIDQSPYRRHLLDGEYMSVRELQALSNLKLSTLYARIKSGWTISDAISRPVPFSLLTQEFEHDGKRMSVGKWARHFGLSPQAVSFRLKAGWTIEQALITPTPRQRRRGVVYNFQPSQGTGAGSTAQETPDIDFSTDAP